MWVDRDAVDYAVGEVWARLTETLADWGGFGDDQALVTTGGIAQARQRETFAQVAEPVAGP